MGVLYRPVNIWTFYFKNFRVSLPCRLADEGEYWDLFHLLLPDNTREVVCVIVCIALLNLNKCDWLGLELFFVSSSSSLVNSESWAAGRLPS